MIHIKIVQYLVKQVKKMFRAVVHIFTHQVSYLIEYVNHRKGLEGVGRIKRKEEAKMDKYFGFHRKSEKERSIISKSGENRVNEGLLSIKLAL